MGRRPKEPPRQESFLPPSAEQMVLDSTPEWRRKASLSAECVSLVYQISERSDHLKLSIDDTALAAQLEWAGFMQKDLETLLEARKQLQAMLASCGRGFSDLFEALLNGRRVNLEEYCPPVRRHIEERRVQRDAHKKAMEVGFDDEDRAASRGEEGDRTV